MLNFLKVEILSAAEGFREMVYSVAEKVDYRVKAFKISLKGNLIEKDLEAIYKKIGKDGIHQFKETKSWAAVDLSRMKNEFLEAQIHKDRYSRTLQDISNLQRKALKDLLSNYTSLISQTGWEMAQIAVPDDPAYLGKKIREFPLKEDSLILMVKKGTTMEIAHGNTLLGGNDLLICIGTDTGLVYLKSLFQKF